MSEKERKDLRDYLEKYTDYDLADEFNTQVYMIDTQEFKDLVLLYYFRQKDEINQLEDVIEDIRNYVEDNPNQMSEDATYDLLQILDKVKV